MLTIKEVAKLLGIAPNTINGWIFKKTMPFPYYRINNNAIRMKEEDVVAYIESTKVTQ